MGDLDTAAASRTTTTTARPPQLLLRRSGSRVEVSAVRLAAERQSVQGYARQQKIAAESTLESAHRMECAGSMSTQTSVEVLAAGATSPKQSSSGSGSGSSTQPDFWNSMLPSVAGSPLPRRAGAPHEQQLQQEPRQQQRGLQLTPQQQEEESQQDYCDRPASLQQQQLYREEATFEQEQQQQLLLQQGEGTCQLHQEPHAPTLQHSDTSSSIGDSGYASLATWVASGGLFGGSTRKELCSPERRRSPSGGEQAATAAAATAAGATAAAAPAAAALAAAARVAAARAAAAPAAAAPAAAAGVSVPALVTHPAAAAGATEAAAAAAMEAAAVGAAAVAAASGGGREGEKEFRAATGERCAAALSESAENAAAGADKPEVRPTAAPEYKGVYETAAAAAAAGEDSKRQLDAWILTPKQAYTDCEGGAAGARVAQAARHEFVIAEAESAPGSSVGAGLQGTTALAAARRRVGAGSVDSVTEASRSEGQVVEAAATAAPTAAASSRATAAEGGAGGLRSTSCNGRRRATYAVSFQDRREAEMGAAVADASRRGSTLSRSNSSSGPRRATLPGAMSAVPDSPTARVDVAESTEAGDKEKEEAGEEASDMGVAGTKSTAAGQKLGGGLPVVTQRQEAGVKAAATATEQAQPWKTWWHLLLHPGGGGATSRCKSDSSSEEKPRAAAAGSRQQLQAKKSRVADAAQQERRRKSPVVAATGADAAAAAASSSPQPQRTGDATAVTAESSRRRWGSTGGDTTSAADSSPSVERKQQRRAVDFSSRCLTTLPASCAVPSSGVNSSLNAVASVIGSYTSSSPCLVGRAGVSLPCGSPAAVASETQSIPSSSSDAAVAAAAAAATSCSSAIFTSTSLSADAGTAESAPAAADTWSPLCSAPAGAAISSAFLPVAPDDGSAAPWDGVGFVALDEQQLDTVFDELLFTTNTSGSSPPASATAAAADKSAGAAAAAAGSESSGGVRGASTRARETAAARGVGSSSSNRYLFSSLFSASSSSSSATSPVAACTLFASPVTDDTGASTAAAISGAVSSSSGESTAATHGALGPKKGDHVEEEQRRDQETPEGEGVDGDGGRGSGGGIGATLREKSMQLQHHLQKLQQGVRDRDMATIRVAVADIAELGGPEVSGVWAGVKVGMGIATVAAGHAVVGGIMLAMATGAVGSAVLWGRHREFFRAWVVGEQGGASTEAETGEGVQGGGGDGGGGGRGAAGAEAVRDEQGANNERVQTPPKSAGDAGTPGHVLTESEPADIAPARPAATAESEGDVAARRASQCTVTTQDCAAAAADAADAADAAVPACVGGRVAETRGGGEERCSGLTDHTGAGDLDGGTSFSAAEHSHADADGSNGAVLPASTRAARATRGSTG